MGDTRIFKRSELYEQVWSKPMIQLAKEYGLSDNGLRKICKKLGIPLPKSGHWSKVQHGKNVERPALPIDKSYPDTCESNPDSHRPAKHSIKITASAEIDPKLQEIIDFEKVSKNKIRVPKQMNQLHPLVKTTLNSLRGQRVHRGIVESRVNCLDVNVSPSSLKRALRIFNTILSAFSLRGMKFTYKSEIRKRHCCFSVWGEDIFLGISEKVLQRRLTDDEIEEQKLKNKYFWETHQFIPTGNLTVRVYDGERGTYCKEFVDGKKERLESRLNEVVVYLYSLSLKLKKDRLEREEQHKIWELERQKEEAKQRRIKIENLKTNVLFELVDSWNTAKRIRSFVEEVRNKSNQGSELDAWIVWANSKADRMDVVSKNFLANWKWNVDRETDKHWDLRKYQED